MKATDRIAKEYSEALFALACESGSENKIKAELDAVKEVFLGNDELNIMLCAPSIPLSERLQVIDQVFGNIADEYVRSFLKLLCERKRLSELDLCIEGYRELLNDKDAVVTAHVVSAVPLTDEECASLRQSLEKKSGRTVVLECSVDESILGGVIVEMLGTVTDGSLRRRLKEIKEVMM